MSKGAPGHPTVAVVVLAARREATLERCLDGLALQQGPSDFVVTVVDSAPSGGAADVALRHSAVHRVVLTSQPGLAALCQRGVGAAGLGLVGILDAAYAPDPDWLASGLALLVEGVEVAVGRSNDAGFADMFIARYVFDRIRIEGTGAGDSQRVEGFVRRCEAAGFDVRNGADGRVRRISGPPTGQAKQGDLGLPSPGSAPESARRLRAAPSGTATGLISVVVCSAGKRPEQLQRCLKSVARLEDPNFEILFVDNAVSPAVTLDQLPAGVKHVHEALPGLDRARNRGILESAGDIVAFVDDDCEVHPDWLTGIREGFADPLVSFVTGRVRPARLDQEPHQWFEAHFSFDRGPCSRRFTRFDYGGRSPLLMGEIGTGASMAFRRTLLDRIGGFDVNLDMGTLVGGGGDLDIFARALEEGEVGHYAADAVVFHQHRDSMSKLRWQTWGYGLCQGAMCAKYMAEGRGGRLHAIKRYVRLLRERQHQTAAVRRGDDRYPLDLARLELLGVALGPLAYVASAVHQRRVGKP